MRNNWLTLSTRYFDYCCHSNFSTVLRLDGKMAAVSRLASDTVESSFSSSSSTVPIDSIQDMSDAALLELRDQTRLVYFCTCECVVNNNLKFAILW